VTDPPPEHLSTVATRPRLTSGRFPDAAPDQPGQLLT
jgi:hypothetical protein